MDQDRPWYKTKRVLIPIGFAGVMAATAIASSSPSTITPPEVPSNTQTASPNADTVAPKIITNQDCSSVSTSNSNEEVVCLAVKDFSGFYTSTTVNVPVYGKVIGKVNSLTLDGKLVQSKPDGSIDTFIDLFLKDGSNSFTVNTSDSFNNSSTGNLELSTENMKPGYNNVNGDPIPSPSYEPPNYTPPAASAKCVDGSYSYSQHRQGTCSHHGGVSVWY